MKTLSQLKENAPDDIQPLINALIEANEVLSTLNVAFAFKVDAQNSLLNKQLYVENELFKRGYLK